MSLFVHTVHTIRLRLIDSVTNEIGFGELTLDIQNTYSIDEIMHMIQRQMRFPIHNYDVYRYYVDKHDKFHIFDVYDFQDTAALRIDAGQIQDELWFEFNKYENIVYISDELLNSVIDPIE